MAVLSVPSSVKSRSLIPIVKGRKRDTAKTLFFAYKDFQRAVRDSRYKLIEYAVNGQRTTQLFDLEADPWELDNLADSLSHIRKLNQLRKALTVWKEKTGDSSPSWKDYNYTQT
jgi:arylsulfatase A-like enzyme